MRIDCLLSQLLGRSLSPAETNALFHLTPQGIAKVNADMVRDIPLESTVAELSSLFALRTKHRQALLFALPLATRFTLTKNLDISKLSLTALMFLNQHNAGSWQFAGVLVSDTPREEKLEILEALSAAFVSQQYSADVDILARSLCCPVIESQLVFSGHSCCRTHDKASDDDGGRRSSSPIINQSTTYVVASVCRRNANGAYTCALNPMLSWFSENVDAALEISPRVVARLISSEDPSSEPSRQALKSPLTPPSARSVTIAEASFSFSNLATVCSTDDSTLGPDWSSPRDSTAESLAGMTFPSAKSSIDIPPSSNEKAIETVPFADTSAEMVVSDTSIETAAPVSAPPPPLPVELVSANDSKPSVKATLARAARSVWSSIHRLKPYMGRNSPSPASTPTSSRTPRRSITMTRWTPRRSSIAPAPIGH